jgi:hypothetical protein
MRYIMTASTLAMTRTLSSWGRWPRLRSAVVHIGSLISWMAWTPKLAELARAWWQPWKSDSSIIGICSQSTVKRRFMGHPVWRVSHPADERAI